MERDGCAVGLVILILFIFFLLIALSPDQPSPPTPASPTSTPTQTPSPTATPEPLEGTGASTTATFTPTPNSSAPDCQEGIEVGKSVNVVYTGVRVRKSAGYVIKNDAQDTIHFLRAGDRATVKAGPTIMDGLCWWKIEHEGVEGWTADHSHEGRLLLQAGQ